ncbi:hypothetical protein [Alkalihalobacillus sp. LMS39]|uniref:hypothetical protein n=1 Tax=Alkalihalobacillus sp. LMS39 TaxID=2924032 RepID=UPI001FB1D97D|nr:hypothetical protein [Alkalihalobacillus sp. LMS39]UOE93235.1 hypothetical protein MM271_18825 [Alkalihalobacillus sp. LMS39]
MNKFYHFAIILFLLVGCSTVSQEAEDTDILMMENEDIRVSYLQMLPEEQDGEAGFSVYFSIEQLGSTPITEDNYSFTLQRTITDYEGNAYETLTNERLTVDMEGDPLPEGTVFFKQFFTPEIIEETSILPVSFFTKPIYQRDIIFETISFEQAHEPIHNNGLTIHKFEVEKDKLSIVVEDVHPVNGLKMTLIKDGEELYPLSSLTHVSDDSNHMSVQFQFAQPIPDPFTIKLSRHRIEEIIWEFPFEIEVE